MTVLLQHALEDTVNLFNMNLMMVDLHIKTARRTSVTSFLRKLEITKYRKTNVSGGDV